LSPATGRPMPNADYECNSQRNHRNDRNARHFFAIGRNRPYGR
jgi:hypothetical protein